MPINSASDYFEEFCQIFAEIEVKSFAFGKSSVNVTVEHVVKKIFRNIKSNGGKLIAVGNGGSAAIAIHALVDYANAGGLRTIDLMSPAMLTCMANDYGYENVFSKPIKIFADEGDILFAISSSGKSTNILKACEMAKDQKCFIVTFSGFDTKNPLRELGNVNFYVPSSHFGFVEIAHETLLHCILDIFVERKNQNK